jgi:hypothetical protein
MDAQATLRRRILEGAERYIKADPSDPFLGGRIAAHIRQGITGYVARQDGPQEAFYDADLDVIQVTLASGIEASRHVYRNLRRP